MAGRLLQGVGGGLLPALAYATIRRLFPEFFWSRAISMLSGGWGVAALTGPFIGGLFSSYDAWRWAFLVNAPIGLVFAVAAERVLPRGELADVRPPFPAFQLLVFAVAVTALALASVTGGGWSSYVAVVVGLILLAALLRLDRQPVSRLLPTGAFDPRVAIGAVSATMGLLAMGTSTTAFVPYILQAGSAFGPMIGGYMMALQAMSWTTAALLTASASERAVRRIIALGPVAMVAGMAMMAWALSTGTLLAVAGAQVLIGSGIGMAWAHLGTFMMAAAPASERDIASSFISTVQLVAVALGSAFAGIVVNAAGLPAAATPAEVVYAGSWLFVAFSITPFAALLIGRRMLRADGL